MVGRWVATSRLVAISKSQGLIDVLRSNYHWDMAIPNSSVRVDSGCCHINVRHQYVKWTHQLALQKTHHHSVSSKDS